MSENLVYEPHQSSIGNINANIMMLIAYLGGAALGFIPILSYVSFAVPIVIFILEKKSPYVKFHAAQASILVGINWAFTVIFAIIAAVISMGGAISYSTAVTAFAVAGVFAVIGTVISIVFLVFEIIAMIKGWKYIAYKMPIVGKFAEKLVAKFMH